jgi:hypothetical protein
MVSLYDFFFAVISNEVFLEYKESVTKAGETIALFPLQPLPQ